MSVDDMGAPSGPGSTHSVPEAPTGLRPSGDDPSRFDPSQIAWLHIRGQFSYHGEALITGTKQGLIALRDALDHAIESRMSEAEMCANDGEGYCVTIRRVSCVRDMGKPPYIDQLARDLAEREREWCRKHERYNRDLWKDRLAPLAAKAIEARSDETAQPVRPAGQERGPQASPEQPHPPTPNNRG